MDDSWGEKFAQAENLRSSSSYDKAEELYNQIIAQLDGDSISKDDSNSMHLLSEAYNNRGMVKYLKVDFDDAVKDYTEALKHKQTSVTYYNRGLIHYRLGRFDQAIEDMQHSLKLDPDFKSAQQCLEQSKIDKLRIANIQE